MSQLSLSKSSKLSKSYVSFVENGIRQPSRKVVARLAESLAPGENDLCDELMRLAGFAVQDSGSTRLNPAGSAQAMAPIGEFSDFLQYCLKLIRHQNFQRAEKAIEAAFSTFIKPVQLKALLAHLELARGSFEQAILFQTAALQDYNLTPDEQIEGLTLVDVIINLGVMHYLWADHVLFRSQSLTQNQAEPLREQARERYRQALSYFEKALKVVPENIYALDEAGRIHVNLADLLEGHLADIHWQACTDCFRRVLAHPDKRSQLESDVIRESAAFLALAYAKQLNFEAATLLLDTLRIESDGPWIVPYIQAVCAALAFRHKPDSSLINQALKALQTAYDYAPEVVRETFTHDASRDFAVIFNHQPQAFEAFINLSQL